MTAKAGTVAMSILSCEVHGFTCIAIGSRRVAGGKCCGSWKEIRRFDVDAIRLIADIESARIERDGDEP
jgi:hypothetical protein